MLFCKTAILPGIMSTRMSQFAALNDLCPLVAINTLDRSWIETQFPGMGKKILSSCPDSLALTDTM